MIGQDTVKLAITIAEGNISHNDIYLLQKNGKLYEDVVEILKLNDSTATFANPSKIDYTKSFICSKVDCKQQFNIMYKFEVILILLNFKRHI